MSGKLSKTLILGTLTILPILNIKYREYGKVEETFTVKLERPPLTRDEQLAAYAKDKQYSLCNPEKPIYDEDRKRSQNGDFGPDQLTRDQLERTEGIWVNF